MTLVSLLAIVVLGVQAPPPARGPVSTIEGVVAKAGSSEGLSQSQITLVRANRPGAARTPQGPSLSPPVAIMTDAEGRFVIKDVAPGTYRVFAVRNGYVAQEYGQRAANRPGTLVEVLPNQPLKNVDFRLSPAGTITGRITSSSGEPLPRMSVQLLRSTYDETGKRQMATVTSDMTDDRGEYRLFWVPPGRYFLSTVPESTMLDQIGSMQGFMGSNAAAAESMMTSALGQFTSNRAVVNSGYAKTFYPATPDAARAVSVQIQPGSELAAIDIRMDKLQGSSLLRGRVVDAKTGQPAKTANVMLIPRDMEAAGATPKTGIYNPAAGTFEIRNVEPGSYMLMAMGGNMLGFLSAMIGEAADDLPATPPPNVAAPETAQMSLEVRGDMNDLVLKISSGVSISGQATVSGLGSIAALPGLAQIRLMLASGEDDPLDGGFNLPTRIAADGKFNVKPTPGTYKIAVMELPPNTYVKSARLGAADILDGTVTIDDATTGTIQLEFGTNAGEIEGSIVDKEMKPVKALQAVLIPEKRARRDLYKTVTSGDDGRFSLSGITPGNYKLFAWEDLEPNAYYDLDVLRQYEGQGKAVVVTESGKVQVELKPIQ
jgi:hypothetical protein